MASLKEFTMLRSDNELSIIKKKRTMSEQKTLKELYEEAKRLPSPAQTFVTELAELTCSKEMTVRLWLYGKQRPDALTQRVLAEHFKTSAEALFPKSVQP